MKIIFLIIIFYALLSSDFNGFFRKDKIKEFIPGTYVYYFQGKFGKGSDSLIISKKGRNAYLIRSNMSFHFTQPGVVIPDENVLKRFKAIYDEKERDLKETSSYETFTFDPEGGKLHWRNNEFKKLKE